MAEPGTGPGSGGDELYLHRDGASQPWRLVAVIHRRSTQSAWRAEYRDHQNGLPRIDPPGERRTPTGARTPGSI